MKPSSFDYHRPGSLAECVALLADFDGDAAVLSGGQSLLSLMRFRMAQPANLISLADMPEEFTQVQEQAESLFIPARVTYVQLQRSELIQRFLPGLPDAIRLIATPAVRSRGTLCGNLCNADPASELPAFSLIMDAQFRLVSARGERLVPAAEFFQGPYMTARRTDEFLAGVFFPKRNAAEAVSTLETVRLAGGFPMAGVTLAAKAGPGGTLRDLAIGVFGVNSVQLRVKEAEAILDGQIPDETHLARAEAAILAIIHPHTDKFASADYRRSLVCTLFRRAITDVHNKVLAA